MLRIDEAHQLYRVMMKLATLIEKASDNNQADAIFTQIVRATDTSIAQFIWDHCVNWEWVTWKKD